MFAIMQGERKRAMSKLTEQPNEKIDQCLETITRLQYELDLEEKKLLDYLARDNLAFSHECSNDALRYDTMI